MASPDDNSPQLPKGFSFQGYRKWIERFFIELFYTNIAFWLNPDPPKDKNILVTAITPFLIYTARQTHAAYGGVTGSAKALPIVLICCIAFAFGGCLLDLHLRRNDKSYLANAAKCYRLMVVGFLIAAAAIAGNWIVPWSEWLGDTFHVPYGAPEIFWTFSFPAALLSFVAVFALSLFSKQFWCILVIGPRSQRLRVLVWSFVFVLSVTVTTFGMFSFGR